MAARTASRRPTPIQENVTPPAEPGLHDMATVLEVAAFAVERRALKAQRHHLLQIAEDVRTAAAQLREMEDRNETERVEETRRRIRAIEAAALRKVRKRGRDWYSPAGSCS